MRQMQSVLSLWNPDGAHAVSSGLNAREYCDSLALGSAGSDASRLDDDVASREVLERVLREKGRNQCEDDVGSELPGMHDDDARVAAWRIAANISEATVQCEQHPAFSGSDFCQFVVARSDQVLLLDCADFVAAFS